jgi:hypothetical protein
MFVPSGGVWLPLCPIPVNVSVDEALRQVLSYFAALSACEKDVSVRSQ